jgi:hypothetical protein
VEEKQRRIEFLEKKVQTKDEVLAELMAEHIALKKALPAIDRCFPVSVTAPILAPSLIIQWLRAVAKIAVAEADLETVSRAWLRHRKAIWPRAASLTMLLGSE